MRKEIEDRLITFAGRIIQMKRSLEPGEITDNLFGQLTRSATSAALNYGEAQGAETRKDFSHKIGIVLKEIRESHNNLKIIASAGLYRGKKARLMKF